MRLKTTRQRIWTLHPSSFTYDYYHQPTNTSPIDPTISSTSPTPSRTTTHRYPSYFFVKRVTTTMTTGPPGNPRDIFGQSNICLHEDPKDFGPKNTQLSSDGRCVHMAFVAPTVIIKSKTRPHSNHKPYFQFKPFWSCFYQRLRLLMTNLHFSCCSSSLTAPCSWPDWSQENNTRQRKTKRNKEQQ